MTVTFADRSRGLVTYATVGDPTSGKARIEWFGGDRSAILEDYRTLSLREGGKVTRQRHKTEDKGHRGLWEALVEAAQNAQPMPIKLAEIVDSFLEICAVMSSLHSGQPVDLAADAADFWLSWPMLIN